jgi:hypothetical protein
MSRSANQTYSNGYWDNIETVSFYPLRDTPQYVMSLWQRYGTGQRLQPIDHPLLHFRDINSNHFYSVANLHPPGFNSRVRRALRFSQPEVDTAIDLSAARHNWDAPHFRFPAGYLALTRRWHPDVQRALPAAAEPEQQAAGAAAENYDISALLAAATDNDAQQLRAWICGICKEGIEAGSELTAAHQVKDEETGQVVGVHVFHKQCLLDWQASGQHNSDKCPTCRDKMEPKQLPDVWSAGMTVNARMGANPYTVQWF